MNQNPQIAPEHICPTTYYGLGAPLDDKEVETVTFNVEMEDETLEPLSLTFWHFPNRSQPTPNIDFGFIRCMFQEQTYHCAVDDLDVITETIYDLWAQSLDKAGLKARHYDFFTGK